MWLELLSSSHGVQVVYPLDVSNRGPGRLIGSFRLFKASSQLRKQKLPVLSKLRPRTGTASPVVPSWLAQVTGTSQGVELSGSPFTYCWSYVLHLWAGRVLQTHPGASNSHRTVASLFFPALIEIHLTSKIILYLSVRLVGLTYVCVVKGFPLSS